VNVIEKCHKVFPILGKATASSPSNELSDNRDVQLLLQQHVLFSMLVATIDPLLFIFK